MDPHVYMNTVIHDEQNLFYLYSVEYAATAESSGTDEDGEVAETDATAGNCNKDEGGEIHVAENVYTAGNCGIDEGDDIHVAENVDMAGNCDIDEGDDIHVAENVDMAWEL